MLVKRTANYTDFDFLFGTLLNGARHGHYSVNVNNPAMKQLLREEIQSIVLDRCLLDERMAKASIFTHGNERVALSIICEASDQPQVIEIYALSVARKFHRLGYGQYVLDQLLGCMYQSQVIARCSLSSMIMKHMLESRGFKVQKVLNNFTTLIREIPSEIITITNSSLTTTSSEKAISIF